MVQVTPLNYYVCSSGTCRAARKLCKVCLNWHACSNCLLAQVCSLTHFCICHIFLNDTGNRHLYAVNSVQAVCRGACKIVSVLLLRMCWPAAHVAVSKFHVLPPKRWCCSAGLVM